MLRDDLTPLGFKVLSEVEVERLPLRADFIVIRVGKARGDLPPPFKWLSRIATVHPLLVAQAPCLACCGAA